MLPVEQRQGAAQCQQGMRVDMGIMGGGGGN